jgi:hypothetical protein
MKKGLLTICASLCLAGGVAAQTIANGAMESWQTILVDNPNGWFTSSGEQETMEPTTTKSTDAHGGTGAIRIETKSINGDLKFGFFTNSDGDPTAGEGGTPYSQKPTHITGYYKSGVVAGDSAIVLAIFKKAGAIVSMDVFHLFGTHSAYTQFSFPLSLMVVPDSVILAVASSNALTEQGVAAGSYVIIDDLAFSGPGITQPIPGGDFESWLTVSRNTIEDWYINGDRQAVERTNDNYKGTYAISFETVDVGGGNVFGTGISNADWDAGKGAGVPFTRMVDTLVFWYKYTPQGTDSAMAAVSVSKNGMGVAGAFMRLPAAATYTRVEMPLSAMNAPDSIRIDFSSSLNGLGHSPVAGSKLWIDEVQFTSEPLNTGVKNIFGRSRDLSVYPNPCNESVQILFEGKPSEFSYSLNDITGKQVVSGKGSTIATEQLHKGIYFVTINNGTQVLAVKKLVKE